MLEYSLLILVILLAAEYWQRRQQAELAELLIHQYCQRHGWQLISISRHEQELRPVLLSQLLARASCFCFEYSEAGDEACQGELYLTGLRQPVFRLADPTTDTSNVIPFPTQRH